MSVRTITRHGAWRRVVFSAECDELGNCPVCGVDYARCDCPGPTQEEEFEYREMNGVLWARARPDGKQA
ncbi:hypothetical protein [Bradyrhizobium sp. USDA 4508]